MAPRAPVRRRTDREREVKAEPLVFLRRDRPHHGGAPARRRPHRGPRAASEQICWLLLGDPVCSGCLCTTERGFCLMYHPALTTFCTPVRAQKNCWRERGFGDVISQKQVKLIL